MSEKTCTKCKVPGGTNGFYRSSSICNLCTSIGRRVVRLTPKEIPENKFCPKCELLKNNSDFTKNSSLRDGLMAKCKPCQKELEFESNLKRKYGLSLCQYRSMISYQKSRCDICLNKKPLVVDHCHISGKVRSLLCSQCNTLIGFAKEEADILVRATEYIRKHREEYSL